MADMKNNVKCGIDTATDNTSDRTSCTMDHAKDTMHQATDHLSEFAGEAHDKVRAWAGEAYDAAKHAGQKVERWAGEAYDVAKHNLGDFGREVSNIVRKHPIPALLIGFGAGVLLGRAARMV